MTEAEWLTEVEWLGRTELDRHLPFLEGKASARKSALFRCACARRMGERLKHFWAHTHYVDAAERFADGETTLVELEKLREQIQLEWRFCKLDGQYDAFSAVAWCIREVMEPSSQACTFRWASAVGGRDSEYAERAIQAALLRDIFGNPFRPVAFEPAWRTEAAVGIALKLYDERDFAAMPILADALQEAGCEDEDVLAHCREPGVHVRGCWVVDLVLGKE